MLNRKLNQSRNFDWILLITVLGICILGILVIFSSNYSKNTKDVDFLRQLLILIPSLIGLFVAIFYNYRNLKKLVIPLYIINLILLLYVLIAGHTALGSQRWINIGGMTFQPSEVAKLIFIITLAYILTKKPIQRFFDLWLIAVVTLPPILLIFKQPDLGTSLVFFAIVLGMLMCANVSWIIIMVLTFPLISMLFYAVSIYVWIPYLLILGITIFILYKNQQKINIALRWDLWKGIAVFILNLLSGPASRLIWDYLLKDYQKTRILIFLNPETDPLGSGYHIIQSKIAVGSGGILGKGLLHGTQTQLNFIPVQHTDFIFSVIGEEFGFIGGLILLILYLIIIWRIIDIALKSNDSFGGLIAMGLGTMMLFHVFVNLGMAIGIMPVVGIPLPFVSYGGTSLLINFIAIGILESIVLNRPKAVV